MCTLGRRRRCRRWSARNVGLDVSRLIKVYTYFPPGPSVRMMLAIVAVGSLLMPNERRLVTENVATVANGALELANFHTRHHVREFMYTAENKGERLLTASRGSGFSGCSSVACCDCIQATHTHTV